MIGIKRLSFKYIHAGDLIRLDKIGLNRDISFFPDPGTLECQYPFRILYIGNLLNRFQVLQGEILSGQPQILQIEIPVITVRAVRHPVHIGVNSGKCKRRDHNHQEYGDELRPVQAQLAKQFSVQHNQSSRLLPGHAVNLHRVFILRHA